jgi:hypothetical protein
LIPGRIAGANLVLGAPKDWDEANGSCRGLPVRVQPHGQGVAMVSAWEPTPAELAALNAGAPVQLHIVGEGHPPVWLDVGGIPE